MFLVERARFVLISETKRRADYLGTDVAVKEFLDLADQPGFDLQKYIGREVEILKYGARYIHAE